MAKSDEKRSAKGTLRPGARLDPAQQVERLLISAPLGSAVADEPAKGVLYGLGDLADDERPIVGQRMVRQIGPLFDMIRHRDTQMPLAAAIYGQWGSGKTTAMHWLDRMLHEWQSAGSTLVKSGEMTEQEFVQVRTVWFYPWKYQNRDDVLRGIIAEVIRATIMVYGADVDTVKGAIRRFGGFLGRSFLSVLDNVEVGLPGTESKVKFGAVREITEEFNRANHPEQAFLNHFEETLCEWTRETVGKKKRLVVFIDDLDRCLPRVALQVLEALKLYLRVPEIIFVVGVDRDVVARLVEKIYKEDQVEGVDAARYLAKMFQVEVTIDSEEEVAEGFFAHVVEGHDLWRMLGAVPAARDLIRDYILHHADRNPREIKRIFNGVMMAALGELLHEGRAGKGDEEWNEAVRLARGAQRYLIRHRLQFVSVEKQRKADAQKNLERPGAINWQFKADEWKESVQAIGTYFFEEFLKQWTAALSQRAEGDGESKYKNIIQAEIYGKVNLKRFFVLTGDEWLERILGLDLRDPEREGRIGAVGSEGPVAPAPSQPTQGAAKRPDAEYWRKAILRGETADLRAIRDAVALSVNKAPDDLEDSDLIECAELDFSSTGRSNVTDVSALAGLTSLRELHLNRTGVTDVSALAGLTGLKQLYLSDTGVADVSPLAGLINLESLNLSGTGVTDVSSLARLTSLRFMDLRDTRVTVVSALAGMTNLESLGLNGTGVTDISALAGVTGLKLLDLSKTGVADVSALAGLTDLKHLYLSDTGVMDVSALAEMTGLKELYLSRTGVTDVSALAELTDLKHLYLSDTGVTDVSALAGMTNLESLGLNGTGVTDEQVRWLKNRLPNCEILR